MASPTRKEAAVDSSTRGAEATKKTAGDSTGANGGGPRDKNGLTEKEFLAQYSPKNYPRPSLTADICVFRTASGLAPAPCGAPATTSAQELVSAAAGDGLQLLLVRRGGHPFLGCWATPGGFVNPRETAGEAARRELAEETGVEGLALEPVGLFSAPGRDPRGWTISQAYAALDTTGSIAHAGDDASETRWFDIVPSVEGGRVRLLVAAGDARLLTSFAVGRQAISGELRAEDVDGRGLAFDHAEIVADAWLKIVTGRPK